MSSSSDQYVFELQFKGKADGSDYKENQFVIIDGSSMAEFAKLKEDLAMCMPEPFTVQYIDDEDDTVSIDTEEEFQEFSKIAKKRSSRGMLMRLILNSSLPLDHGQYSSHITNFREQPLQSPLNPKNVSHGDYQRKQRRRFLLSQDFKDRLKADLKEKIKDELKNEILSELKDMGPAAQTTSAFTCNGNSQGADGCSKDGGRIDEETKEFVYEEDSDGNMFVLYLPEKNSRKTKLMHYQKKLEKKEAVKIDQRLEKLEMKRKKLMEKYSHQKMTTRKVVDSKSLLPMIVSAIATKESSELVKRVTASKVFTHVWTIINDGTLALNNVELRHTWSSPGLEPEEAAVKLPYLLPGQDGTVAVKFRAPTTYRPTSFISYWHFFRLVDNQWQEFGHYVSVTGFTKPPKTFDFSVSSKTTDVIKKPKQDKVVSFMDTTDEASLPLNETTAKESQKEEKVLNEESISNITLKKQMEQLQATLASSEIAAEMAREAARLLAMATATAEGNTASPIHSVSKPSEGDKLNNCGLDEAAAGVQQLNLLDSESDTDANMETNEDSDRGFVIVTMTPNQSSEEASKCDGISKENGKESNEDSKTAGPSADNTKDESQAHTGQMSFPRLDPNVTYPVFPPPPPRVANTTVYLPPSPMMPNFNYPVFNPPQNASSHGIVFPPPVNYSQIPTYPPIPTFPPAVPLPLSTQPTFVSQPPQMTSQPSQNLTHIPFNPFGSHQSNWTRVYSEAPQSSTVNNSTTPTGKPTEAGAQQLNTVPVENSVSSTPAETTQPQPQVQQQPQPQVQQQPQPQAQQQPQPQLQPKQQTEANPAVDEQDRNGEPVQILPQALVDGAINVAATAYSTAWNALNNLRPKEGDATEFDPVFENNMAMLVEMGFNNLERNARLLKRFNNDISQVIGVICSTGGGCHNLDID